MSTPDEKKKFAILMAMLGTAFGEKGIRPERIDIYHEHLQDIDIDILAKAVSTIIKTRKYSSIPTVAEIREAVLGGDGQAEDEALAAWSQATRLISAGRRSFDERVNEAVALAFGSWRRFGETDPEMEAADRKHFVRCYLAIARKRRENLALNGGVETKRLAEGGRQ